MIFIFLASITPDIVKKEKSKDNRIKVSLKEMPKTDKNSGLTKKKIKPPKIAPPMPKGKQLKKIVKKPPVKFKPQKPKKKPKLNKPTPKPKIKPAPKIKPVPPQKPYIPVKKPKPKSYNPFAKIVKKDDNLSKKTKPNKYAWMHEDKSEFETKKVKNKSLSGSNINQNIKQLYGEEFGKLSEGQQKYIIDNQEIMRRITQQVLTRVAKVNLSRDMNVNKKNIIEFYLHPNGDMTDFKFLKKSGYYVLDDTTKETIEFSYSRYPRPKEKTLIRYNVFYNLARY